MSEYDKEPLSRVEEILDETSSGTEYDKEPLSRVELRLKEVMAKIDGLVPDATVYKAGGSVTFTNLPTPSKSTLGYVYDVSDAFTTTSDFKEGSGKKYPAGTNVAIVDVGTDENPVYKYDVLSGFIDMDNYVKKEAGKGLSTNDFTDAAKNKLDELENYDDTEIKNDISGLSNAVADKVDKVSGKSLSTNDYTDADKALVQDSPITVTATTSPISTANGKPRAITIYGKSEVVDGAIKSAGDSGNINVRTESRNSLNVTATTQTINGVTFRVNPDKTITVSGTATATTKLNIAQYLLMGHTKRYLSGATINGSANTIRLGYAGYGFITTANTALTLNREGTDASWDNYVYIEVTEGYTANNVLFKPMISYTDDITYEPYIGSTIATFTTGTPLRGITGGARDVMEWDGSAAEVTKKFAKVKLVDIGWDYAVETSQINPRFYARDIILTVAIPPTNDKANILCTNYVTESDATVTYNKQLENGIAIGGNGYVYIVDKQYTTVEDFVTSLGDAELIYELATPTTTPLTQTEIDSIASLRTFEPQTHAQNNAGATMTIEAYANTANGQAISDMQPTRSPLLTLTASGWTNNAQTVTFAHDVSKRNTIDVEPANIKAWTAAGILATAETATSITFECDTVPTADLSFRITSMEVR